ncbi:MAG: hydantoinase B/oxoprolinase family protein [Magnetococcales bacterium]|nr:hydantoinase B/oxoprolinase family protein [Magnetococcales bacterium]
MDRGGTFTDLIAIDPQGRHHPRKLLSQSDQYDDAAIEGIRRFLNIPPGNPLPRERIAWIRLGTTVATNALLERKGEATGLVITHGFRDLLEIGDQQRPDLFALNIQKPELLYNCVVEVQERMGADGAVITPLDETRLLESFSQLREQGITSLAIVFLHAWKNPQHEEQAARLARSFGFTHISVSHKTLSLIQIVGRGRTTLVDAYLTPVLLDYARGVQKWTGEIPLLFMSSSGSLLHPKGFTGKDAILSGPAGGVLGVAGVAEEAREGEVIGFDMGGTSTDVCRYDGQLTRVLEVETAGIRYQAPMLHVETVAAGGGSILHFDGRKLAVGPDSAGADPGPACYGLGGPATITDANLLLGRIVPRFFPQVFGPGRDGPLDPEASRNRFEALSREVLAATGELMSVEQLALGFVRIANETMGRPIKALSIARGFDLRHHGLISFGGAGGQHACGIARHLGIQRIHIHPLAGLLSAYGMARASHRRSRVVTLLGRVDQEMLAGAAHRADQEAAILSQKMCEEAGLAPETPIDQRIEVDLRSLGADSHLTISFSPDVAPLTQRFQEAHRQHYGFDPPDGALELVNLRVEVIEAKEPGRDGGPLAADSQISPPSTVVFSRAPPKPITQVSVWFEGFETSQETPVHERSSLRPGMKVTGPLLICEPHSVVVVEPGFDLTVSRIGESGEVLLTLLLKQSIRERVTTRLDPILLELFNHRFMGIAARMGETLARTAHSVNIKERWDFSCALFDGQGRLIANAPHIPVHLGAMGETVRYLIRERAGEDSETGGIQPGDVYISNDPNRGGSHLPDVTVISPVFRNDQPLFYVASRGHHADIGGIVPGSMPPFARRLVEEGVVFSNLLAVRGGMFLAEEVEKILNTPPYPARNLKERLSDLKAQIAANNHGIEELNRLCDHAGDPVVTAYMDHMRQNARSAMAEALSRRLGEAEIWQGRFQDRMDDGSVLAVGIEVSRDASGNPKARVDFSGTAPPHPQNLNAPPAVVRAAVLYVFRTLIAGEIPLNDGCLEAIEIHIPENTMLNPGPGVAVSGGNVETSQRVVDVLYGALGVAAASQGTMNNFLFGAPDGQGAQYYETIAGGSGAIQGGAGASGVQVHMTNTRITDPEVLEYRFPQIRLEGFALREGSGGHGRWPGGEGVIRSFRFNTPLTITLLSERRKLSPFGLAGGTPGKPGINRLIHNDGFKETLPGRYQGEVNPGDRLEIHTPGGGGFGEFRRDK